MKETIKHIIIAILSAGILFSCTKTISFKGDEVKPLIVFNSLITERDSIFVNILKSRFFLESTDTFEIIKDAKVSMFINEQYKEDLTYVSYNFDDERKYIADYIPKINDRISFTVEKEGFETISCETEITHRIPVKQITLSDSTLNLYPIWDPVFDENGNFIEWKFYGYSISSDLIFSITIDDPKDMENYYSVDAKMVNTYKDNSTWEIYLYNRGIDFGAGNISDDTHFGTHGIFTDGMFNGNEYTFKYHFSFYDDVYYPEDIMGLPVKSELIFTLSNYSRDFYLYKNSSAASINAWDDGLFSEPVQIYNNIKGGIGILGSRSITSKTIEYIYPNPDPSTFTPPEYYY